MSSLTLKRKTDGKVFKFDFMNYGRGRWNIVIATVDGEIVNDYGDPVYPTEREARRVARANLEKYTYYRGLGWCIPVGSVVNKAPELSSDPSPESEASPRRP